jgi:hypothetical protein
MKMMMLLRTLSRLCSLVAYSVRTRRVGTLTAEESHSRGNDNNLKTCCAQLPIIGPASLIVYRIKTSLAYYRRMFVGLFRWWFTSNELANYTYDLEPTNQRYLAALLKQVLNVDHFTIERHINEAFGDTDLKLHISLETDRM